MARSRNAVWAAALSAGLLLTATGCGGSGTAAAPKSEGTQLLGQKLEGMVSQVGKMGIIEWHGELLTKSPAKGGQRIVEVDGRYSPSTGYSELSMQSDVDGSSQLIDYLVVNDRAYFNSDRWGPNAADCWADVTEKSANLWALPTDLDPTWPFKTARVLEANDDEVSVALGYKAIQAGLPRGLAPALANVPYDTEAQAVLEPHGFLVEVGVDVMSMWQELPAEQRAGVDTRKSGWWAMTLKESQDDSSIEPPGNVFDPAVTPPSQCRRG